MGRSGKIFLKYILMQIPAAFAVYLVLYFLRKYEVIGDVLLYSVMVFWIVKDMAMYPFVKGAYDSGHGVKNTMIGRVGVSRDVLEEDGYITVGGELWRAVPSEGEIIQAGEDVQVVAMEGLTLSVKKI